MTNDRWRDADAYAYLSELSLAGLAWEFLRRNDDYRADYAARLAPSVGAPVRTGPSAGRDWGLSVAADPNLTAEVQPIFWRPQVSPRTILLTPAPLGMTSSAVFDPASWPGELLQLNGPDGAHLLLRLGREEHRLWTPRPLEIGQPLTTLQPLDEHLAIRSEAAWRFLRRIAEPSSPAPARRVDPWLRRIILMLRAIDARAAGVSQRRIAEGLLGFRCAQADEWEDCAARATVTRLLRYGAALVGGGYLELLRRASGL